MITASVSHPENHPSLSNLWNRGHGSDRLDLEIGRGRAKGDYRFSVVLVQFDGLTGGTDRLGHVSSDDVWRRVLGGLTGDLGPNDLCCRLGGDDFMLVLPEKTESECREIVARLRARWTITPGSGAFQLDVSIGVARYPEHGCTVGGLLGSADEALYADRNRLESARGPENYRQLPQ